MKNTILKQINDIGTKIGYPFYFYADGSFGKSIVSGKMNVWLFGMMKIYLLAKLLYVSKRK